MKTTIQHDYKNLVSNNPNSFCFITFIKTKHRKILFLLKSKYFVRSGIRIHAHIRGPEDPCVLFHVKSHACLYACVI